MLIYKCGQFDQYISLKFTSMLKIQNYAKRNSKEDRRAQGTSL
jgi:hypothetical protein